MYCEGLAEALAVARAKGISLPDDLTEQKLAQTDALPYQMRSSMLEDLDRGRRLELPWLSGAIPAHGPGARGRHAHPRLRHDRPQAARCRRRLRRKNTLVEMLIPLS